MQILGRDCHEETGGGGLVFDEAKATWFAERSMSLALGIGLEDDSGELRGFFLIDRAAPWYSIDEALWELNLYIEPKHRGIKAAALLVDAGKAIADDLGLKLFVTPMSQRGSKKTDQKDKFFERRGLKRIGSTYCWG